jgi:hypothetical protein
MNLLNAMAEGLMKLASLILGPVQAAPEDAPPEPVREPAPVFIPADPQTEEGGIVSRPRRLALVEIPGGVILMPVPEPQAHDEAGGRQLR